MANPSVNDFSLDPYQVDEETLNTLYKRALEKTLRKPKQGQEVAGILVGGPDFGSTFRDRIDKYAGEREMTDIEGRKKALAEKWQNQLAETLRNPTPENLASFSGTRSIGLDATKRKANFGVSQDIMKQIEAGMGVPTAGGQSGDDRPPLRQLEAMMRSGDAEIEKQGKMLFDAYYKPHGPNADMFLNRGGGMRSDPGAMSATGEREAIKRRELEESQIVTIKYPDSTEEQMTLAEARRQRKPGFGLAPSALGGAVAAERGGMGGGTPAPVAPPTQAPSVAMTPPSRALPNANPDGLPSQEEVMAQLRAAGPVRAPAPGSNMPPFQGTIQPGGQANIQALPESSAASTRINPGQIAADKELQMKRAAEQAAREKADIDTMKTADGQLRQIQELKKLGQEAPTGAAEYLYKGLDFLSPLWKGKGTEAGSKAQSYESQANEMIANIIKQYGSNPSNRDLETARARVAAGTYATPRGRAEVMDMLERAVMFEKSQAEKRLGISRPTEPGSAPAAVPGKQSSLPDSYWSNQAMAGDTMPTSALPNATKAKPGFLEKAGNAWEGFRDAQGNVVIGAMQALPDFLKSDETNRLLSGENWRAEQARQDQRAKEAPAYGGGRTTGEIINPTLALPGGAAAKATGFVGKTALPLASNALSGFINPAASGEERAANTAISAGTGAVIGKLADAVLPATHVKGPVGDTTEALARKFGANSTKAQADPSGLGSMITRMVGGNNPAALTQIENITKTLLQETGSTATHVTGEVLQKRGDELAKEFTAMFPRNVGARVSSLDARALSDAISNNGAVQDLMGKNGAPNLAKVLKTVEDASNKGTWVQKLPLKTLHDAWLEIGQVAGGGRNAAAGEVRSVLEDIIDVGLKNKGGKESFKKLNQQWGALEDLKRVWAGGTGQGEGSAAGLIAPKSLAEWGGRHPHAGASVDDAAALITSLGIKDYKEPNSIRSLMAGMTKPFNASMVDSSPGKKAAVDWLRKGAPKFSREWIEGQRAEE